MRASADTVLAIVTSVCSGRTDTQIEPVFQNVGIKQTLDIPGFFSFTSLLSQAVVAPAAPAQTLMVTVDQPMATSTA